MIRTNRFNLILIWLTYILYLEFGIGILISDSYAYEEPKEPITVKGDRVEYLYEQKKVTGINNIVITYKDLKLTCDKIEVDMEERTAVAEGNVTLIQEENIIRGQKVSYDFDTGKGTIIKAEVRAEPWYGKGKDGYKVADKAYLIQKSYLTTCDLDPPHYRIQAREVRIFLGEKVEARHVVAYVGKYPVFYFPYYYHPLDDRRPRVTIIPGRNSGWGYYVLSAWRYYFHEWSRGYVHLDWREKKGFGSGVDYKYKLGYFGKGLAQFYYADEGKHMITAEESEKELESKDSRWGFHLRHKWDVDDDTVAVGELHKLSDALFSKDYFYKEEYEKVSEPETYFSVIRTKADYVLSAYFKKRINSFFTEVEKLPELKLDIKNQKVSEDLPFYYNSTTSFSNLTKQFSSDNEEDLKANRFDTYQGFSYPFKVLKVLNMTPYVGDRLTWYSEDALGHVNEYRLIPTMGIESFIRFFKIFPYETNFLNLDINGLRHLIEPSIHYTYTPSPNLSYLDLKQFDGIDGLGRDHRIILQLENKLQTKRGPKKKIFDLARFIVRTDYLVDMKDPDDPDRILNDNVTRLSDFDFNLELKPYSWLFIKSTSKWDYTRAKFESFATDLVAVEKGKWSFGFGHRFENSPNLGVTDQFVADASYQISPKWKFSMYHRLKKNYDSAKYTLEEQGYSIARDLHCWLAEFTYNIRKHAEIIGKSEFDHRIWLTMRLKAFPELPIKLFSATYSRPRPGSRSQNPLAGE